MSLAEALPLEIKRCLELIEIYKTIPTGGFGAMMIRRDVDAAIKASAEGGCGRDAACLQRAEGVRIVMNEEQEYRNDAANDGYCVFIFSHDEIGVLKPMQIGG